MLTPCRNVWGNANVIRSSPLIEEHRDVIFVPLQDDVFIDRDRQWGVFDRGGRLIEASAYFRGAAHSLVSQDLTTSYRLKDLPDAPEDRYVYAGAIIHHYGHFLTTTLSRFWRATEPLGQAKLVCHSHGPTDGWLSVPYRAAMLNSVGITTDMFRTFDRPTRIRHLTIPRIALEEQNFAHVQMRTLCHRIGDVLLAGRTLNPNRRPLYWSKAGLTHGVTRISNEADLVSRLERKGVEILAPETMTLADQIYEYATRTVIAGTSSSAFHTSVFTRANARLLCITERDVINSNFVLFDRLNGNRSEYFFAKGRDSETSCMGGFLSSFELADPTDTADALLRMMAD